MSKSVKSLESTEKRIRPLRCPVCSVETNSVNRLIDKDQSNADWYNCQCGVVFQDEFPLKKQKEKEEKYRGQQEKTTYLARLYAPIIEEVIMGRMMLEVGLKNKENLKFFEKRGWLTWGIDSNINPGGNIYQGDFEKYDFTLQLPDNAKELGIEETPERLFDLIWMNHSFEQCLNPLEAIQKCYDLLPDNGVLFLSTPDIEFIFKTGVVGWPHWCKDKHYVMWSERALCRELERFGFKVILSRRNYSSRFESWHDVHIIAQKRYF